MNVEINKVGALARKLILPLRMPLKHLLCSSSRPCIGSNHLQKSEPSSYLDLMKVTKHPDSSNQSKEESTRKHISRKQPSMMFKNRASFHYPSRGIGRNKKSRHPSNRYRLNSVRDGLGKWPTKLLFKNRVPFHNISNGYKSSPLLKDENKPNYPLVSPPHSNLLCNASRPCKYFSSSEKSSDSNHEVKSRPPSSLKGFDSHLDNLLRSAYRAYMDISDKNDKDNYFREVS